MKEVTKRKEISCINTQWNLEKWYRRTYLQSRNRDIDVENKCMDTKERKKGWEELGVGIDVYTLVVQSQGRVQLFATPWTAAHQASLSLTISRSSPKFMSIELVMPSIIYINICY